MRNTIFLFIVIFCLVLTGCPSGFLEEDSLFIEVNKNEFAVNEDIEFTLGGKYSSEDEVNSLNAGFFMHKYDAELNERKFVVSDIKSINNIYLDDSVSDKIVVNNIPDRKKNGVIYLKKYLDGSFKYDYSKKRDYLTDINDSVVFTLNEPGEYYINAQITLYSQKYRLDAHKYCDFKIIVTE